MRCALPSFAQSENVVNWWVVYGLFMSVISLANVWSMGRRLKQRTRQYIAACHAINVLSLAASNMWDTLTPEQVRTLHPQTVEVGNGVMRWDETASDTFSGFHFTMRTTDMPPPPKGPHE